MNNGILSVLKLSALFTLVLASPAFADENVCGPMTPAEEQTLKLQQENSNLAARIQELESRRCISVDLLRQKKTQRLKEIATDVRQQRKTVEDFQGFVTWMSANLAGYNKYIQTGSYAAVAARMLPIPYAGQASIFTKFLTQFTISLNSASLSINNYLGTSLKYIEMVDTIDPAGPIDQKSVDDLSAFADQQLIKDMYEAQNRLTAVSDLASGALSFLQSLNNFVSGTDEYWNKMKGAFRKDIDPKEKSYISESTSNLKTRAAIFNSRLKSFEELGKKQTTAVKSLAVYDELNAELAVKSGR
ncbi:MAG: hypothetical protein HY888_00890 [Deltaproteobacteria bacterium]|nr:hypothetical protein [Deltaproteobacteria bacterium]